MSIISCRNLKNHRCFHIPI